MPTLSREPARLLDLSHEIHAHPETNYEEHFAHDLLAGELEDEGLAVERAAYGVDTAFAARAGESGPTIAVLLEYDALPGIGHACGHNIIATAGLGAGLATAALAAEAGGRGGRAGYSRRGRRGRQDPHGPPRRLR